jgi:hypothetical protein
MLKMFARLVAHLRGASRPKAPTTFQRHLAVHMHFARPRSALSD